MRARRQIEPLDKYSEFVEKEYPELGNLSMDIIEREIRLLKMKIEEE